MFTGIVSHTGKLRKRLNATLTFSAPPSFTQKLKRGTSIAVNGVCLTVEKKSKSTFSTTIMPETAKKTVLGTLPVAALVNLEVPITPHSFLSGHIVQGHVDGVGKILKIEKNDNSRLITVQAPSSLTRYIAPKGSIAVNGVSLTVIQAGNDSFSVGIIPFTFEHTMLKEAEVGDKVNIEVDAIGKYVYEILKEGRGKL